MYQAAALSQTLGLTRTPTFSASQSPRTAYCEIEQSPVDRPS